MPNTKNEDPLLGGYKPKTTTTTETKSPVPPIPQTTSTMSNAAMATVMPLEGGRPLVIPDKDAKPLPENLTGQSGQESNSAWSTQSETSLQQPVMGPPQPINKGEPKNVPAVAAQNTGIGFTKPETAPVVPISFDQLQQELKKRGVRWQKQEPVAGGVKFLCGVPHPKNARAERVIEAIAPDLPGAIMGALKKIDQP